MRINYNAQAGAGAKVDAVLVPRADHGAVAAKVLDVALGQRAARVVADCVKAVQLAP